MAIFAAPSCRKKKIKQFLKENGCRSRKLVSRKRSSKYHHLILQHTWDMALNIIFLFAEIPSRNQKNSSMQKSARLLSVELLN